MLDDKTLYTIRDEDGQDTTITLDKIVADVLQELLPDVHAWVQKTYDRVTEKKPDLGQRQKGNLVRFASFKEAEKSPRYTKIMDDIFGL